jgi:hypothetical protein
MLIAILFFACSVFAYSQSKPDIVVIDLQNDMSPLFYDGSKTYFLTKELVTKKDSVCERSEVERVFNERGFNRDSLSNHALEIAHILGVQKVLTGHVTLNERTHVTTVYLINVECQTVEATATIEQKWDRIKKRKGQIVRRTLHDGTSAKVSKRLISELIE